MKFVLYIYVVIAFVSVANAEIVHLHSCGADEIKNCVINEARISPCKEAEKEPPLPCKFKKQKTASIEVDFTPEFNAQNMTIQLYWANGFADLPLVGMETNACKTTTCPSVAGVKQTYSYDLKIDSYFPLSTYDVKYLLKGEDYENQKCCFIFRIKIIR